MSPGPTFHPDQVFLDELAELRRRVGILERAPQLRSSSVDIGGVSVPIATLALGLDGGTVVTTEVRTSSSYGDLTTVGPQVTNVEVGSAGRLAVWVGCYIVPGENNDGHMSYEISGATSRAPSDDKSAQVGFSNGTGFCFHLEKGLAVGLHTVTAKYRRSGIGSADTSFARRTLIVIPF